MNSNLNNNVHIFQRYFNILINTNDIDQFNNTCQEINSSSNKISEWLQKYQHTLTRENLVGLLALRDRLIECYHLSDNNLEILAINNLCFSIILRKNHNNSSFKTSMDAEIIENNNKNYSNSNTSSDNVKFTNNNSFSSNNSSLKRDTFGQVNEKQSSNKKQKINGLASEHNNNSTSINNETSPSNTLANIASAFADLLNKNQNLLTSNLNLNFHITNISTDGRRKPSPICTEFFSNQNLISNLLLPFFDIKDLLQFYTINKAAKAAVYKDPIFTFIANMYAWDQVPAILKFCLKKN